MASFRPVGARLYLWLHESASLSAKRENLFKLKKNKVFFILSAIKKKDFFLLFFHVKWKAKRWKVFALSLSLSRRDFSANLSF